MSNSNWGHRFHLNALFTIRAYFSRFALIYETVLVGASYQGPSECFMNMNHRRRLCHFFPSFINSFTHLFLLTIRLSQHSILDGGSLLPRPQWVRFRNMNQRRLCLFFPSFIHSFIHLSRLASWMVDSPPNQVSGESGICLFECYSALNTRQLSHLQLNQRRADQKANEEAKNEEAHEETNKEAHEETNPWSVSVLCRVKSWYVSVSSWI